MHFIISAYSFYPVHSVCCLALTGFYARSCLERISLSYILITIHSLNLIVVFVCLESVFSVDCSLSSSREKKNKHNTLS